MKLAAILLIAGLASTMACKSTNSEASLRDDIPAASSVNHGAVFYTTLGVTGNDPMYGVRGITLMTLKTALPFQNLFPDIHVNDPKNPAAWDTLKTKLQDPRQMMVLGIPTWAFLSLVDLSKSDPTGDYVKLFFTNPTSYDRVVSSQKGKSDPINAFVALAYDPSDAQDVATSTRIIKVLNGQVYAGNPLSAADIQTLAARSTSSAGGATTQSAANSGSSDVTYINCTSTDQPAVNIDAPQGGTYLLNYPLQGGTSLAVQTTVNVDAADKHNFEFQTADSSTSMTFSTKDWIEAKGPAEMGLMYVGTLVMPSVSQVPIKMACAFSTAAKQDARHQGVVFDD